MSVLVDNRFRGWLRHSYFGKGAVVLVSLLLTACGDPTEELRGWTEQQRKDVRPKVSKLEKPQKFEPATYEQISSVDPFSTQKLAVAVKQESRQPNSLLAPEMNRRKEPLEAYPLDALRMMGSLMRSSGQYVAILRADNLNFTVMVGNYIGQNFGKITRVTETEVTLREIVQDPAGEWVERVSSLQLQEQSQEKSR
jgi:type IV pilus assembly protein PilP